MIACRNLTGEIATAHKRPTQNAEILAKQLSLMRQEAQITAQDSRQLNADAANKTKVTPELQIGQKVYKVKDVLGDTEDHKTAPKFEGLYIIIDQAPYNVYKLQHFHTGKIVHSHVHVDKLKSGASARETRHQETPRHSATSNKMELETSNDSPGMAQAAKLVARRPHRHNRNEHHCKHKSSKATPHCGVRNTAIRCQQWQRSNTPSRDATADRAADDSSTLTDSDRHRKRRKTCPMWWKRPTRSAKGARAQDGTDRQEKTSTAMDSPIDGDRADMPHKKATADTATAGLYSTDNASPPLAQTIIC